MNKLIKKIWHDESAQGATEYILILVVIVAIAMLFGNKIKPILEEKISQLSTSISSFSVE